LLEEFPEETRIDWPPYKHWVTWSWPIRIIAWIKYKKRVLTEMKNCEVALRPMIFGLPGIRRIGPHPLKGMAVHKHVKEEDGQRVKVSNARRGRLLANDLRGHESGSPPDENITAVKSDVVIVDDGDLRPVGIDQQVSEVDVAVA
jgi:hypothetical protein